MINISLHSESAFEISIDSSDFDVEISKSDFDIDFAEAVIVQGERLPDYEGEYAVLPKVTEQVLPTKDTSMTDDVTVLSIPISSVSNPEGGITVTIGQ